MANNPLQQFFRQPKIFVSLPSRGVYNKPDTLDGNVENMPVFGMTGMDEILMKTPDALISGESTVKVIESCCPVIKNAWEMSSLDTDLVLIAIRIATYGNLMEINHTCPACETKNEYNVDLNKLVEFFADSKYDNRVVFQNLVIKLQPLTYKQVTDFSLQNFQLQQRLVKANSIENEEEQKSFIAGLFQEMGKLQNDIYVASIDSIETGDTVVNERAYIKEFLENCDKAIFDAIKAQFDRNAAAIKPPKHKAKCENCGAEAELAVEMDEANFFGKA